MKKGLLIGCGLLAMVFGFSLWFLRPPPPSHRINIDGYHGIELGMTQEEVVRILGVPPGDYGPGKGKILETVAFSLMAEMIRSHPNAKRWLAGEFAITVRFDDCGQVNGKGTDHVYRPYDTIPEMLCQKVGLRQQKPYPAGSLEALFDGLQEKKPWWRFWR